MKFRALLIAFIAFVLAGAVACGGGDKKKDEMPTEETEQAMEEEAPAEEGMEEEAPAESAPMEEDAAEEEGGDDGAAEEGGEEGGDEEGAE